MRKALFLLLAVVLVLTSCTTFEPIPAQTVTALDPEDYTVLGEVVMQSSQKSILGITFGGDGYAELLAEAKEKYPSTDHVIDVYADVKYFNAFPFYQSRTVTLYGTAVDVK